MAVFRIERTKDYTVMSNHHLRNHELSLKAKGLLSMMLSLPDDWNYTTRGLAKICKEGVDAIGSALRELETAGYIVRNQLRDQQGRISDTEYVIYEKPQPRQPETPRPDTAVPDTASPDTENPYLDTPYTDEPYTEKPAQLNKDRRNKEKEIPDESITDTSNPDPIYPPTPLQGAGYDGMGYEAAREIVRENIEYDILVQDPRQDREQLDEVVELIAETLCSRKKTIVIAGDEYPAEMVKEKLLRITSSHIEYVFDCLKQNTTYVRNIKKYLLASLFNAPSTIGSYYSALVNHDMYGDGLRGR
mgnify:CR=1 FL=1